MSENKTLEQMAQVMLDAAKPGAVVQVSSKNDEAWADTGQPSWNWSKYIYRIKKQPREIYVTFDACGMVKTASDIKSSQDEIKFVEAQ